MPKSWPKKKEPEREEKISSDLAILKKYRSPVANRAHAEIIVDKSSASGADFRVILAIMGKESGFCRVPIKLNGNSYNCFGYINKVKYPSYAAAFNDLIPKIARQYANRYGWNFEALAKAYGQVNWQKGASDMRYYATNI
jgi:hypothetical protein